MKRVKYLIVLVLSCCLLSGQVVFAEELSDSVVDEVKLTDETEEVGEPEQAEVPEVDSAQVEVPEVDSAQNEVETEGLKEVAPRENNEISAQAESPQIIVDTDSIMLSTFIVHVDERFIMSFKLVNKTNIFDGTDSKIILENADGGEFNFPIYYDNRSDTYIGTGSLESWSIGEEVDISVKSINLSTSTGKSCTIVNSQIENMEGENVQDLSGFDFIFVNKKYPFRDVAPGVWYQGTVDLVNYLEIMTGTREDKFAPTSVLSRAQFATIIYRMEDCPAVEYNTSFRDVPKGQFYTDAVIWANKAGIITGYNSRTFGPVDSITREQMATMMCRYGKYKGFDVSGQADLSGFPDYQSITNYARDAISWANYEEIITGDGGKINPHGKVSRAVCATIIVRFLNAYL